MRAHVQPAPKLRNSSASEASALGERTRACGGKRVDVIKVSSSMLRCVQQQQQQFGHSADQRRPTRIGGSSCEPAQVAAATTTMRRPQEQQQATSNSGGQQRLKSSTIAKVPPANKSRLKQPQAHSGLPVAAGDTSARPRPSSLALRPPSSSSNATSKSAASAQSQAAGKTAPKQQQQQQQQQRPPVARNHQGKQVAAANLSGLRNLVAVVHPQHSQRVNSTSTTAINRLNLKPTITNGLGKYEGGGKVNKDGANNKAKRESERQDVRMQIAGGRPASKISPSSLASHADLGNKNNTNKGGHHQSRLLSVSAAATKDAGAHVNCPASKALGNKKEANKHSFGYSPTCYNSNNTGNNKEEATKSLPPTTTTAATCLRHHNKGAINVPPQRRLQPKPMGHQVLSLMMLDVGLLPATTTTTSQQPSPHRHHCDHHQSAHVRLRPPSSSSADGEDEDDGDDDDDNCRHHQNERALSNNSSSAIDYRASFEQQQQQQSNNYQHSRRPHQNRSGGGAHEMLRLQLDNESCFRSSISLPCSPRLAAAASGCARGAQHNNEQLHELGKSPLSLGAYSKHPLVQSSLLMIEQRGSQHQLRSPQQQTGVHGRPFQAPGDNNNNSSSCSSLNLQQQQQSLLPPLLSLANQLEDSRRFEELVSQAASRSCLNLASGSATTTATTKHKQNGNDEEAQVAKQHELLTHLNDPNSKKIEKHRFDKIDHATAAPGQPETTAGETETVRLAGRQQQILISRADSPSRQKPALGESCGDHQLRRQVQSRSHSISGQDFHTNGQYQRLKQSLYLQQQQQQNALLDHHQNYQNYTNRIHQIPSPSPYQQQQQLIQHQQGQQFVGRSPSPHSVSTSLASSYGSHHQSLKYAPADRLVRHQFHTSLECLNAGYTDYTEQMQLQQQQQKLQEQQTSQQQQQQALLHQQNQHYAASYVLMQPPNNTQINQNGDQDLAAAAMGPPPPGSQYQPSMVNSYSHQTQNLINRAMAQVSHGSPLRRLGLGGGGGNNMAAANASSGVLNHLTNGLHHPMRAGHSSLSLASPSFIIEDKLQNEIRKLQSELKSEKEKNEALNSQLNINSSLMAAFEQSLTTLNTRLRQLTTLNERKDNEIEELKEQLKCSKMLNGCGDNEKAERHQDNGPSPQGDHSWNFTDDGDDQKDCGRDERQQLLKTIDDLKRQLIEKDRLLTDTRLEALSAAHQLEQMESKMNGEHGSLLVNEDELDEGVMVVNHSPSDSDAVTDSAHFSEINSQVTTKSNNNNNNHLHHHQNRDMGNEENFTCDTTLTGSNDNKSNGQPQENNNFEDKQSNHSSSDYQIEVRNVDDSNGLSGSLSQREFNDSGVVCKLMDNLLLSN